MANEYNEESIKIKESLNHTRGLIFSYKLKAKIEAKHNLEQAFKNADMAYKIAVDMALKKEVVSSGIVLAGILNKMGEMDVAKKILHSLIPLSKEMGLTIRYRQILLELQSISSSFSFNCLKKEAVLLRGLESQEMRDLVSELLLKLPMTLREQIDNFLAGVEPITPILRDSLSTVFQV